MFSKFSASRKQCTILFLSIKGYKLTLKWTTCKGLTVSTFCTGTSVQCYVQFYLSLQRLSIKQPFTIIKIIIEIITRINNSHSSWKSVDSPQHSANPLQHKAQKFFQNILSVDYKHCRFLIPVALCVVHSCNE